MLLWMGCQQETWDLSHGGPSSPDTPPSPPRLPKISHVPLQHSELAGDVEPALWGETARLQQCVLSLGAPESRSVLKSWQQIPRGDQEISDSSGTAWCCGGQDSMIHLCCIAREPHSQTPCATYICSWDECVLLPPVIPSPKQESGNTVQHIGSGLCCPCIGHRGYLHQSSFSD